MSVKTTEDPQTEDDDTDSLEMALSLDGLSYGDVKKRVMGLTAEKYGLEEERDALKRKRRLTEEEYLRQCELEILLEVLRWQRQFHDQWLEEHWRQLERQREQQERSISRHRGPERDYGFSR